MVGAAHGPTAGRPAAGPHDPATLAQAEEFYQAGKAQFDAQEWQAAYRLFNKALRLNPRHAPAYNYRGAAYRHLASDAQVKDLLEHHNAAILDFTRAMEADPTWGRPYLNRGVSYDKRAALEPLRRHRLQWLALAVADLATGQFFKVG